MAEPILKLKAWSSSYTTIAHFIVEKRLPDKWLLRVGGKKVEGFHTLKDVYRMQRADPNLRYELRIAEHDGTVIPESPWIEVYDDTGFWGKVGALVTGIGDQYLRKG